jgi:4-hydroxyphenylpyruvate dioxygenase-like putative hemolysin
MMLLTLKGRKSGNVITTPVDYLRQGDVLYVVSFKNRWFSIRSTSDAPPSVAALGWIHDCR